jgi:gamma-glutamyl-gamma-aminobutyrate hydrolase PuuD
LASAKLIGDDFFSEKSITNILHQIANMQKKNRESALVITILTPPDLGGYTLPAALKNIEEKTRALGVYSPFYPADPTLAQVLNQEVNEILQEIRQRKSSDDLPIPQEIIRIVLESRERAIEQNQPNPYPALTGILGRAEIIAKKSDALFLPGGEDIPESLYRRDVPLLTDTDYRRSLLEIALIHESLKRGIPLMGVCRGFQMANVYFGAGLNNVAGQDEPQLLTIQIPKGSGWLDKALQSSIMGICLHQQSVTQSNIATEYLEYPIFHEGIAKAASPQHAAAAPMILLQFHPELVREEMIQANVSYAGNLLFWKVLQNSAQTYRNKKKVLLEQSMEGKKD